MAVSFGFDTTYARLPERFFSRVSPTAVPAPRLIRLNAALADQLGLDVAALSGAEGAAIFAGNALPADAGPIATVYAGHQFGHFSPRLGDGRAILLGEVVGRDGVRRDIQLKGAGPTPYSRHADGRAAVGPVLREFMLSEAMFALGVPTTRSLAAATTGEMVMRETPLPGAVLTRVAASHIRVGTFQYFAGRSDAEAVRVLADYVIARHYPETATAEVPAAALLAAVVARQAALVARWLLLGFIHGVMNTDNMSIAGETIDYGPCAFLDAYDPAAVFSSIDHAGRYAYGNQPRIAMWNLTRLAEALLPLLAEEQDAAVAVAQDVLAGFAPQFEAAYLGGLRAKIGLTCEREGDDALVQDLLARMAANAADFTLTFRNLDGAEAARALFTDPAAFDGWSERWQARLALDAPDGRAARMRAVNPAFIPRNHLVQEAIAAAERDDFAPFEALLGVLARPFADQPDHARYSLPARPEERVLQTFCGT